MNSIAAENRELTLAESINQRNPTTSEDAVGVLLGTDFRHAVEFSRNGRTTTPPSRASSSGACPPYAVRWTVLPRGVLAAALSGASGASTKLGRVPGRVKPRGRDAGHPRSTACRGAAPATRRAATTTRRAPRRRR